MKFTVVSSIVDVLRFKTPNEAVLYLTDWDDWFTYRTQYKLSYVDNSGKRHDIGEVKIAEYGMEHRTPKLPKTFTKLDKKIFFSLGQDDYYYDRLNAQGKRVRKEVLEGLNDMASDLKVFRDTRDENVVHRSLMRYINEPTVTGQFHRIALGGARLTKYEFTYFSPGFKKNRLELDFKVTPESNPPTNIHVLIGTNGVGKTFLMSNMIDALTAKESSRETGEFVFNNDGETGQFANLIYVSFSAFDVPKKVEASEDDSIQFFYIGLKTLSKDKKGLITKSTEQLEQEFVQSILNCSTALKRERWEKAITTLEADALFKESDIGSIFSFPVKERAEPSGLLFRKLSSGHKLILLTVTRLVELVEEKSIVLMDEPEGHLHPPLLSSFVRALSELLINRNGVAIVATHSPVVLQEAPRSCVWKLQRSGLVSNAERLEIESFGENVGTLTHEVFSLEVSNSGFHRIIKEIIDDSTDDYEQILDEIFNGELGLEARSILKALLISKRKLKR